MGKSHEESPAHRVSFGVVLMVIGVALLLDKMELIEIRSLWQYWPLLVIALGVGGLFERRGRRRAGRDTAFILNGLLMLMMNFHAAGLDWHSHWPLLIVGGGLGIVAGALFDRSRSASTTHGAEVSRD